MTAEGRRLTPAIVFTGASLQGQWYPRWVKDQEDIRDWKYDYSLTGWSNAEVALKWLKEIYLPETKPANPRDWRLLILDEHSSYDTTQFMFLCQQNRVQLLFLPSHSSHKSQPLDRSVFSPLKNYFRQNTKVLAHCRASAAANKQRFLLCYRDASRRGCSVSNIRSGFQKTGIWPFKPSAILDDPEALIGDAPPPQERPRTPPVTTTAPPTLFNTPRKAEDIRQVVSNLRGRFSPTNRTLRALFRKMEKSLDLSAAERAALQAENSRLQEDFRAVQPHTKKRVRQPANDRFARIEDIIAAEEASHLPPKRRRGAPRQDREPAVEEAQEVIIHGLDRLRQAEEM